MFALQVTDEHSWEAHFAKIDRSNLIHSWAYGKAKQKAEKWIIEAYVLVYEQQPIALLQVRKKRYGFIHLVRINRGPLWFNAQLQKQHEHHAYGFIRHTYAKRRGCVLVFSPETFCVEGVREAFKANRFIQYNRQKIGTIWVDLSKLEIDLRKSLRGKWRNQLCGSEKKGLLFTELPIQDHLEWFLLQYQLFRSKKDFKGPSLSLIVQLIHLINQNEHYKAVIFCVRSQAETIAATLLIQHGATCTYLLAWNNENGRKMNASNLLLWSAVLAMKKKGCKWLDLGGISECNSTGKAITHFKRGLGGEEFWFAGDFIAI